MRRVLTAIFFTIVAIIVLGAIVLRIKGPAMLPTILSAFIPIPKPEDVYPHAPPMPPVVETPVDALLSQYEAFLKAKVPSVISALQPGLTNFQIEAIEAQYNLKLPQDLRALYLWRDGTPRTVNVQAFPNHEFLPLELALANRDEFRRQVKAGTPEQQQVYAAYAAIRGSVSLLMRPAMGTSLIQQDLSLRDPFSFALQKTVIMCSILHFETIWRG